MLIEKVILRSLFYLSGIAIFCPWLFFRLESSSNYTQYMTISTKNAFIVHFPLSMSLVYATEECGRLQYNKWIGVNL